MTTRRYETLMTLALMVMLSAGAYAEDPPQPQTPLESVQPSGRIMEFRIRDSQTGYTIPTKVTVRDLVVDHTGSLVDRSPPSSVEGDAFGRGQANLPPGYYFIELSAPGYRNLRTHFALQAGARLAFEAYIDSIGPPEELRDEVVEAQRQPGHVLLHGYVADAVTGTPSPGDPRGRAR
jgi:hypothetical protein